MIVNSLQAFFSGMLIIICYTSYFVSFPKEIHYFIHCVSWHNNVWYKTNSQHIFLYRIVFRF